MALKFKAKSDTAEQNTADLYYLTNSDSDEEE